MISERLKYRNSEKILFIITICVFLVIISILTVASNSIKISESENIAASSASVELFMDQELNVPETKVLLAISGWVDVPGGSSEQDNTYQVYYDCLKKYFRNPGTDLSADGSLAIDELVSSSNEIIALENEVQFCKMSFDAREVIIHLLKQIYEISGLKLVMSESGSIDKITDLSGNIVYQKENRLLQSGFRIDAVIITLAFILSLFGICIIISRKNQIIVKGGDYDGFDEKEFA